ncbi:hypothetical protein [Pseudoalteromonas sp. Angola-4]|uniref:hypothetical protein n=1 Tax=Pseudoalteromonas sp. Angola-4 TaxID=3025335 RepID=UPI0023582DCD|nr:hypothetical protein [Pseudoalteromonas sp. Angola-4]MDC9509081.1 hypothetical protein [Pseudoalteromonas sp. Angola-4]
MIKKTILLVCIGISSVACANIKENKIAPTYSLENKTDGYFMEPEVLETREQVNALFSKSWFYSYEVVLDRKPAIKVDSCKVLSKALREGYKSSDYKQQNALIATNKICTTWADMGKLKPSNESFLGSFKHGAALPKKLPPELSLIISNDDERRLAKANSWEEMSHIQKMETVNDDQAIYYDNSGGIQRLTIMAKGDYNQDGIEDVVLHMANAVERGSYSSSYSYVVTRLAADAPYTLLKQF